MSWKTNKSTGNKFNTSRKSGVGKKGSTTASSGKLLKFGGYAFGRSGDEDRQKDWISPNVDNAGRNWWNTRTPEERVKAMTWITAMNDDLNETGRRESVQKAPTLNWDDLFNDEKKDFVDWMVRHNSKIKV